VGVVLALIVPCLAFASLVCASGKPPSPHFPWLGAAPLALAAFFFTLNIYIFIGRPLLHRLRHKSDEGFRYSSPAPIVASLFAAIAVVAGWGVPWIAGAGLLIYALDIGGPIAFLVAVWRDDSFWHA
jgi:hypothetical protein